MNKLGPSFNALYIQARPKLPPGQSSMQQYERFATASLAFTLQHDLDFRGAFLKKICEYDGDAGRFEVSLEVKNQGSSNRWDLALSVEKEAVFIIEAKIDAPLDPWQDPDLEDFGSGYGSSIIESYPDYNTRTYIVLWQKDDEGPFPKWISLIASVAGETREPISWFGYEDGGRLNVGFYCEPSKAKDVQEALRTCAAMLGKTHRDNNYVWIESDGSHAEGDKEWFREVYECLSRHIELDRQS